MDEIMPIAVPLVAMALVILAFWVRYWPLVLSWPMMVP